MAQPSLIDSLARPISDAAKESISAAPFPIPAAFLGDNLNHDNGPLEDVVQMAPTPLPNNLGNPGLQ